MTGSTSCEGSPSSDGLCSDWFDYDVTVDIIQVCGNRITLTIFPDILMSRLDILCGVAIAGSAVTGSTSCAGSPSRALQ